MDQLMTTLRAQWDRMLAVLLLTAGAVLLVVGWIAVSGASNVADQLSYLASSGLGGLFCLGLGASLLVSSNLQDEWRKLDDLTGAVREATWSTPHPNQIDRTIDIEDHEVIYP